MAGDVPFSPLRFGREADGAAVGADVAWCQRNGGERIGVEAMQVKFVPGKCRSSVMIPVMLLSVPVLYVYFQYF